MTQPVADLTHWPQPPENDPGPAALLAHEQPLRALARAKLGDAQAVEEIFQDVALAVVSNTLARPQRWGGWLTRIVQRQVLLYRRKAGRRRRLIAKVAKSIRPIEVDSGRSPLDFLINEERRNEVRAALDRLVPADAEILRWKYHDDLSTQEIARKLVISSSAAEARLHRARGKLRSQLLGYEVNDASAPD